MDIDRFHDAIVDCLREYREQSRISQTELAKMLNKQQAVIHRLEAHKSRNCQFKLILQVCVALGVSFPTIAVAAYSKIDKHAPKPHLDPDLESMSKTYLSKQKEDKSRILRQFKILTEVMDERDAK